MPRLVPAGVPGVGKSTLLRRAQLGPWSVVNMGTELLELAQKRSLAADRDALRRIPPAELLSLRVEAARRVGSRSNIIVDSQMTVRQSVGYSCVLPPPVATVLRPSSLILVEATPATIQSRRELESGRSRDRETSLEIEEHQQHNRAAAWSIAAMLGIPLQILRNDTEPEASAAQLEALLQAYGDSALA